MTQEIDISESAIPKSPLRKKAEKILMILFTISFFAFVFNVPFVFVDGLLPDEVESYLRSGRTDSRIVEWIHNTFGETILRIISYSFTLNHAIWLVIMAYGVVLVVWDWIRKTLTRTKAEKY